MTHATDDTDNALLLGIDIGTSSTKVSAFNLSGVEVASATREYEFLTPRPGFVEQSPDTWWEATQDACKEVTSVIDPSKISGIGVAGQSWATVFVDTEGKVLANSPLWMDTRAAEICARVGDRLGLDQIFSVSGNPFSPTYSTPKLLWFMQEQPDLVAQAESVLQSNSFIVFRLTDRRVQDISMTYGLQFADIRDGSYNEELARGLGVDLNLFPEVVACDHVVGFVTAQAASLTGLTEGTPVVAGGLDAACGALGAGVFRPSQCQEQGGQAGGISVATDTLIADPSLICSHHVVPGLWLLQGGTSAGGAALRWAAAEIGHPDTPFSEIDDDAVKCGPVPGGIVFLPYLAGERSPIWDPDAKGVFFGLTLASTRSQMLRAVMEGVAFSLKDNVIAMKKAGAQFGQVFSIGGASLSRLWTQIKCDVTGLDISVPTTKSATPLGAALLAGVGTGVYEDYAQAVEATQSISRMQTPDPENQSIYAEGFSIYQDLYRSLAGLMKQSTGLSHLQNEMN